MPIKIKKIPEGYEMEGDTMPSGIIVMWHGLIANIPTGWLICDGNNGTPDLRAKFIRGAPPGEEVGGTGGEDTHILTEAEMPAHTHPPSSAAGFVCYVGGNDWGSPGAGNVLFGGGATGPRGGNQAHENRPVYYELIFIKKT